MAETGGKEESSITIKLIWNVDLHLLWKLLILSMLHECSFQFLTQLDTKYLKRYGTIQFLKWHQIYVRIKSRICRFTIYKKGLQCLQEVFSFVINSINWAWQMWYHQNKELPDGWTYPDTTWTRCTCVRDSASQIMDTRHMQSQFTLQLFMLLQGGERNF